MAGSLVSYEAVAEGPITNRNLVARVLSDGEGKGRVDELLFAQKQRAMALLSDNRDVVEALRDALIERDELVGEEIIEVIRVALSRRTEPVSGPTARV
jgi:ATP-dependent Zn protease